MPDAVVVRNGLGDSIERLKRGGIELLCHTAMLAMTLGACKAIKLLVDRLWGKSPLLLNRIPVSYLFDTANLFLISGFLLIGVPYILIACFRGNKP